MTRILGFLRRLWRREQAEYDLVPAPLAATRKQPEYCFLSPSPFPPSLEDVLPYRSPQAATFYQYQCNYWEAHCVTTDSLTSWQWLDEHSFSRRYIARKEYSS